MRQILCSQKRARTWALSAVLRQALCDGTTMTSGCRCSLAIGQAPLRKMLRSERWHSSPRTLFVRALAVWRKATWHEQMKWLAENSLQAPGFKRRSHKNGSASRMAGIDVSHIAHAALPAYRSSETHPSGASEAWQGHVVECLRRCN